jgi:photosystem II stability/assembly factor-like uncharacterized protein
MKNDNRRRKIVFGSIYLLFIIVAGTLVYYFQFYEEDLNDSLPLTATVKSEETNQENIGSHLLNQYLQQYQETTTSSRKRITNVKYNEFQLIAGKQELIEGSFVISPGRTAFVIGDSENVRILLSTDKGEHWRKVPVPNSLPGIRMRLLGFISKQDGYLILTVDKTMSWEANAIFKTNDGGKSWVKAGYAEEQRLITDGGFVTDQLGFISFGSIHVMDQPPRPSLYRTTDGGKSWAEVEVPIPVKYKGVFIEAEVPTFDGTQGTMLVNHGPSGDYQGGKVLARYISLDEGATWTFAI